MSHIYDHYALGIILEVDMSRDRYVVQWDRGPVLEYPEFILEPANKIKRQNS